MEIPLPIVLRELVVAQVHDVTPRMRRLTLTGSQVRGFSAGGRDLGAFDTRAPDDHVKLVLPDPRTGILTLPVQDDGHLDWPRDPRAIARDYTVRRHDPQTDEVDIDFVLHDHGVAGRWAAAAAPGDVLHLAGPRGSSPPPPGARWWLLVADETALPAVGRFIDETRAGDPEIIAVVLVDGPQDEQDDLGTVQWVHRRPGVRDEDLLAAAVAGVPRRPAEHGWAWVAGEASIVRRLRTVLAEDHGLPREQIGAHGYWGRGATLEDTEDAYARLVPMADLLVPHALRTAVDLGICAAVADGATTVPAIAAVTGTESFALAQLLDLLVELDVLALVSPGTYVPTAMGHLLAEDGATELLGTRSAAGLIDRAWAGLTDTVRGHGPGFEAVVGRGFWDHLDADPELSASFDDYIAAGVTAWGAGVGAALREAGARHVVDVGGGNGTLLARLLDGTGLTGALVELPGPAAAARGLLAKAGLQDRAEVVAQSFFEPLPSGADVYVLAQVLHDWPDHRAVEVLRRCAEAAAGRSGRPGDVLVVERLADHGPATRMNLMMLNLFGSRERTSAEMAGIGREAGLDLASSSPAGDHLHVLTFRPTPVAAAATPRDQEILR